jgi:beta-N-acetylhexosaminidase
MIALRRQVGQMLIAGVEGLELTALEGAWLKLVQPGGIILFRRNIDNATQTHRLLTEANNIATAPLLRCVDLEGGLVDRLRDAIAPVPSQAAVAATGKPAHYRTHGRLIGHEARALGFNVVLAPVLDLALPESRPVMRTRTGFSDPEEMIRYVDAFLSGLEESQVLGCGKHFPGLGRGTLDSHHSTPVISTSFGELWQSDLLAYRRLKSRLPIVMVAHAVYSASREACPASISRYWIAEILKKRIGYRGLILSDDMEMGGILSQNSIEIAAVEAVVAGTHLIEVCKDAGLLLRAFEAILTEAEKSAAFRRLVETASRKIHRVKQAAGIAAPARSASARQIESLRNAVMAFRAKCPEPEA